MRKSFAVFFLFFHFLLVFSQATGGMWIPTEVNENELKQLGFKLTRQQLFNPTNGLNWAVAHFDGGCTAEVISPNGLLLTNHHCGYDNIQSHSSVENDLLTKGFWANSLKEELPNPGVTASFVVDIKDVTSLVLNGTSQLSLEEREKIIKQNQDKILAEVKKESYQDAFIRPFYNGNKFYLFVVETYKDVRLVGAPPSSIGKFGSDTDNWVWPRHTGDFTIFRIYADKNNRPAEYSPDNVPYKPKRFFPISIKGIKENDATLVYGFPGRTDEYQHSEYLKQVIEIINPIKISIRDAALKLMDEKMRTDDKVRIQYASKYASIANHWKKWSGERQGLIQSDAVNKRKAYEAEFLSRLKTYKTATSEDFTLLNRLESLHQQRADLLKLASAYDEVFQRNSNLIQLAVLFNRLYDLKGNSEKFNSYKKVVSNYLDSFYKDSDEELEWRIAEKILEIYFRQMPESLKNTQPQLLDKHEDLHNKLAEIKSNCKIFNSTEIKSLFEGSNEKLISFVENEPLTQWIRNYKNAFEGKIQPQLGKLRLQLEDLQKRYMALQMELFKDKRIFPDANGTLRITYGRVKGYSPRDAVNYHYQTFLDGVKEKYIPGDYEFDVHPRLLEILNNKDFGNYYDKTSKKMPLAFIASNHTTGGNSGSPALDINGNLIGLNFDRVWEGTMSDLHYDPTICRNIMVDMRYMLLIIDKFANNKHILNELVIVK